MAETARRRCAEIDFQFTEESVGGASTLQHLGMRIHNRSQQFRDQSLDLFFGVRHGSVLITTLTLHRISTTSAIQDHGMTESADFGVEGQIRQFSSKILIGLEISVTDRNKLHQSCVAAVNQTIRPTEC